MDIAKIIVERDGVSESEAIERVNDVRESIWDIFAEGGSYDEIEELLIDDLGLEMDYIIDLI